MIPKNRFTCLGWGGCAALVAAALFAPGSARAANPDGDLRIEPIAAYNFVVDSNVESPSTDAPRAACERRTRSGSVRNHLGSIMRTTLLVQFRDP